VENDEILCKKWRNEMPLAFALHTWQLTVETSVKTIDISPFKTDIPKQPQPHFTLRLLFGNDSRERFFQFACFQRQGCGAVVKMIQLRLRNSFFMNMAPAPELMVFMCSAPAPEQWRF